MMNRTEIFVDLNLVLMFNIPAEAVVLVSILQNLCCLCSLCVLLIFSFAKWAQDLLLGGREQLRASAFNIFFQFRG